MPEDVKGLCLLLKHSVCVELKQRTFPEKYYVQPGYCILNSNIRVILIEAHFVPASVMLLEE